MKTKILLISTILGLSALNSNADITINLPESCNINSIDYYYAPIKQYAEATSRSERGLVSDSVLVNDSKALIAFPDNADAYLYGININDNVVSLYAVPQENILIEVSSCDPFSYSLGGSALVEGINQLNILETPVIEKFKELNANGNSNPEEMEKLAQEYNKIQLDFINGNPESPAAPVALLNLEGEDFISTYEALQKEMGNSIVFPLVKLQYDREKKNLELEKKQEALQTGEVDAPSFTLKDLKGNDVSLNDFKGKWVILDFWGSWCPWCIKGFPELKEAYEKYSGELEIIGIDCKESETDWKAGVEKYELPWVNVYNPEGTNLLSEYGVQGFPTKAIIDPQGKIRNITVGHNPEFFVILSDFLKK